MIWWAVLSGCAMCLFLVSLRNGIELFRDRELVRRVASLRSTNEVHSNNGQDETLSVKPAPLVVLTTTASAFLVWFRWGIVPAVVVAAGALTAVKVVRGLTAKRKAEQYEESLVTALDSVVRSLQSGAGIRSALQESGEGAAAGTAGDDLTRVVREAEAGSGLQTALDNWAQRKQLDSVKLCVDALILSIASGAANAKAVEAVTSTLRSHRSSVAAVKTAATEARASAVLLVILPVVISAPLVLSNERTRAFMFEHPVGIFALVAGLGLNAVGALWMNRLVGRATC